MKDYKSYFFFILLMTGVIFSGVCEMQAAVIHVTTTQDNVTGSLRAAIKTANTNPEKDTIYLPAGTYLLTGAAGEDANTGGDLDFNSVHKISIIGDGRNLTIIDGNKLDRVLHILKGSVSITGVTIRGGKTPDAPYLENSSGGGGIRNNGTLELSHCTISDNTTGSGGGCHPRVGGETGGGSGSGGGIINFGTLKLTRCIITNNSTGKGGHCDSNQIGGFSGSGGGIYNREGFITLTGCTVSYNKVGAGGEACGGGNGGHGGGIYNSEYSEFKCYQCTFNDNSAGDGGYADCAGSFSGGNGGSGGAIFNYGYVSLTNCTVSNNSSGAGGISDGAPLGYCGNGGGICNDRNDLGVSNFGQTDLINCTITGNFIGECPEPGHGGNGGGLYNFIGSSTLVATILANNRVSPMDGDGPDGWGEINSLGYNLIKNTIFCDINIREEDIYNEDPLLGPLADNGGATQTHALLPGSPAIDAGHAPGLSVDQRGFVRPVDIPGISNVSDGSDIGAYEYVPIFLISGKINYGDGTTGLEGVTLTFSNNGGTTSTDSNGFYSQSVPLGWSGTVTPAKQGYTFTPVSKNYSSIQTDHINQDYRATPIILPAIALNRTHLNFGFVNDGNQRGTQSFSITNSGGGILYWEVDDDANWLSCSPTSGRNKGTITAAVETSGLAVGTYTGMITISAAGTSNSPQRVNVTLVIYAANATGDPFGYFETPTDGATVYGSIPVTGWTLDDIGVSSVQIYRAVNEHFVYIGDAVFVEGARPDVELAYPNYPDNYKAGWGYMLLTNVLPKKGNGSFTLHVLVFDKEGHRVHLGWKTIHVDNAHAVKPFGAIDTPTQGGTAAGTAYRNAGWVLTPQPNKIPVDGHTIGVWIDGRKIGNPFYNIYRQDVAALFPGYANSNGAHAYLNFDTTAYENGMHTIMWTAVDNAGNSEGIGSRYFTVQNSTGDGTARTADVSDIPGIPLTQVAGDYGKAIRVCKGFQADNIQSVYPDESGHVAIEIKELMPVEIRLSTDERSIGKWWGFLKVGEGFRKLPIGSGLDSRKGIFSWHPGPGFIGTYQLVFLKKDKTGSWKKNEVSIKIIPRF